MARRYLVAAIAFVSLIGLLSGCAKKEQTVTVYRDTYGVPHIFSDSDVAAAYAFGRVQAEDRLQQLMKSFRIAEGRMAEVFGEKYVNLDYEQRVWKHAEVAREKFGSLPKEVREILTAFAAGINDYVAEHPEKAPSWSIHVEPWHPVAFGRTFIWGWPLGQAKDDMRRGLKKAQQLAPGRGSNQWVVAPKRSKEKVAIALIDPHLSWDLDGHWYEVRIHTKDWRVAGMVVVGTPMVGLGHNEHLSWAATTGGPDCGDCYLEVLDDGSHPTKYRYNGQWKPLQVDTLRIVVKTDTGADTVTKVVYRTHHGPIYEIRGNTGYALAVPYEDRVGLVEQLYEMNKAASLEAFKKAMARNEFMPQNIMVADVKGNIFYLRTGRVPVRSLDYDWTYPVPGDTSATEWQGIHPQKDLVQLENPKSGYMQNCNISPGTMLVNSPLKADKYLPYIYNDRQDRSNPRGRRAVEVLSKTKRMTREQAFALAFDTKVYGVENWQKALKKAWDKAGGRHLADIKDLVDVIAKWNGRLQKDQPGATLYRFWRIELGSLNDEVGPAIETGKFDLSRNQADRMLRALRRAADDLRRRFGKTSVAWGEWLRLRRGENEWPLDGGSFENGISVLRAIWGRSSENGASLIARGGQSCPMLVFLSRPVDSYSVLPWGISDNPDSPHFADQAPLFASLKMKPTWFVPDSLMKHVESKTTLTYQP